MIRDETTAHDECDLDIGEKKKAKFSTIHVF